jgi:hypothetical protein
MCNVLPSARGYVGAPSVVRPMTPSFARLPEGEGIGFCAWLAECNPQQAFADRVVSPDEVVEPTAIQQPSPPRSTSTACDAAGGLPSRDTRKGVRTPGWCDNTRCTSRAWNRSAMLPPACLSTTCSRPVPHSPPRAQRLSGNRCSALPCARATAGFLPGASHRRPTLVSFLPSFRSRASVPRATGGPPSGECSVQHLLPSSALRRAGGWCRESVTCSRREGRFRGGPNEVACVN